MRFPAPLIPATLIRRYKRFLADVALGSGETLTVHVANPGSMIGLSTPGARVYVSKSDNARRKLSHSWELVEVDLGSGPELVGVNTSYPNALVLEAIAAPEQRICSVRIGELIGVINDWESSQEVARPTAIPSEQKINWLQLNHELESSQNGYTEAQH